MHCIDLRPRQPMPHLLPGEKKVDVARNKIEVKIMGGRGRDNFNVQSHVNI